MEDNAAGVKSVSREFVSMTRKVMQSFANVLADIPDLPSGISKKSGFLLNKNKSLWERKHLKNDLHRDVRVNEALKAHLHQNSLATRTVDQDPLLSEVKCANRYTSTN